MAVSKAQALGERARSRIGTPFSTARAPMSPRARKEICTLEGRPLLSTALRVGVRKAVNPLEEILDRSLDHLTFLCGAGVSRNLPSNLPTVSSFLAMALNHCGASPSVKRRIERKSVAENAPRFEVLVDGIRKLNDPYLTLARVFDTGTFNRLHSLFGAFLDQGSSVVTTNFDNCIELACHDKISSRLVFKGVDLKVHPPACRGGLSKPHGSSPMPGESPADLVISVQELSMTSRGFIRFPNWRRHLVDQFRNRTVIAMGYSGSDDFDISPILLESDPSKILWFQHSVSTPYPVEFSQKVPPRIRRFDNKKTGFHYFRGSLNLFAEELAQRIGAKLSVGPGVGPYLTAADYLDLNFGSSEEKLELLNLILLNYSMFSDVVVRSAYVSAKLSLQRMKALFRLGRHEEVLGERNSALLEFATPQEQLQALYFESSSLAAMGRLNDAVKSAKQQVEVAEKKYSRGLIQALNQLGGIYFQAQKFDDAEITFEAALKAQELSASIEGEATSLWGLGIVAQVRGDYGSFLDYTKRAYELFVSLGDEANSASCKYNLGDAYYYLGRRAEAREHFESAFVSFKRLKSPLGRLYVNWMLGKIAYIETDWLGAVAHLEEAVRIMHEEAGFPWVLDLCLLYNVTQLLANNALGVDRFAGCAFSERLYILDIETGNILKKLVDRHGEEEIVAAENYVFRTGEELIGRHHLK